MSGKPLKITPNRCCGCGKKFKRGEVIAHMLFEPGGFDIAYGYFLCLRCCNDGALSAPVLHNVCQWLGAMYPHLVRRRVLH